MAESITEQWLADIVSTAQLCNHGAHTNLISKNGSVSGIPGFEQIEQKFKRGVIANIHYTDLKIRAATESRVMFVPHKTITADDGTYNAQGIACFVEKKLDGHRRLIQRCTLSNDETRQYLPELSSVH